MNVKIRYKIGMIATTVLDLLRKKDRKNILKTVVAILIASFAFNITPAFCTEISGFTTKSDIVTYINNYPIRSFNINGYTAIVAEDLKFYGFDVVYDYTTRTLTINSNPILKIHTVADTGKTPNGDPIVRYQYDLGSKLYDIYSTDIKTYMGGEFIQSFNINGLTAIYVSELARYGDISYNDAERNLYVTLYDKDSRKTLFPVKREVIFDLNTAITYLKNYWKENNMYVFSLNLTGNETLQSDYKGKYYDIRCKSWLYDGHIFRVYESGYVTY